VKTEMHVTAGTAGVVTDVLVGPGDQVGTGRPLVVLGPHP
jgi:biotin carboxyl carrier protein